MRGKRGGGTVGRNWIRVEGEEDVEGEEGRNGQDGRDA